MKAIALLPLCLALAGCPASDDIQYPNPDDVPGVVRVIRTHVEWRVVSPEYWGQIPCGGHGNVDGCTWFNESSDTCVIFAVDAYSGAYMRDSWEQNAALQAIGHEYSKHCARQERD